MSAQVGLSFIGTRCAARPPTSGSGEKTMTVDSRKSSGEAAQTFTCTNSAGHRGGLAVTGVVEQ
jgi:hypothetical protein